MQAGLVDGQPGQAEVAAGSSTVFVRVQTRQAQSHGWQQRAVAASGKPVPAGQPSRLVPGTTRTGQGALRSRYWLTVPSSMEALPRPASKF